MLFKFLVGFYAVNIRIKARQISWHAFFFKIKYIFELLKKDEVFC
jgi:hypothetical protein